jgi:hypothetical protein
MTDEDQPKVRCVVDTSSIIEVRRLMAQEPQAKVKAVYDELVALAVRHVLVFPHAVIHELKEGSTAIIGKTDYPLDWARSCESEEVPNHELYDQVRAVLAEVPDLLDHDKPSGTDEADPYVVGLALKLYDDGETVIVVTEESRDSPDKTSMRSACGILGLPTMSMRIFLRQQGIWPSK